MSLLGAEESCTLRKYPHSQGYQLPARGWAGDLDVSISTSIAFTSVFNGESEKSCTLVSESPCQ